MSCVCGLVVREGSDLVRLDGCGQDQDRGQDSLPQLSIRRNGLLIFTKIYTFKNHKSAKPFKKSAYI